MIEFFLVDKGQSLDLPSDLRLTLNLRNPVFDPENIDRVWTLPFKVSTTRKNKELLGFANRLDHYENPRKRLRVFFYVDGVPFDQGLLQVTKSTEDIIELVFQSETLDLAQKLRDLRLRSLNIPVQVAPKFCTQIEMVARRLFIGPLPYITTTINGVFFSRPFEEHVEFLEDIEAVFPGLLEFVSTDGEEIVWRFVCRDDLNTFEFNTLTPNIPPPEGGTWVNLIPSNTISDSQGAEALIDAYKDYLQTEPEAWRAPTIYAPYLFDENNQEYAGYENVYNPSAGEYLFENHVSNPPDNPQPGWRCGLLPLPRLKNLLEGIASSQGLDGIDGIMVDDEEMAELLLWQNRPLDDFSTSYIPNILLLGGTSYLQDTEFFLFPGEWNLAEYTPDITALELLQRLTKTWAWVLDVYNGRLRIRSAKGILTAPPRDITKKIERSHTLTLDRKTGYFLGFEDIEDDFAVPGQLEDVEVGDKSIEYISGFSSLYEITRPVGFDYDNGAQTLPVRNLRIPATSEIGTSAVMGVNNDSSLRLLFWRGFVNDADGTGTYPYASHSDRDLRGDRVGNYSMDWAGENGRYEKWWKELIQLEQYGRKDKRVLHLNISDLIGFRNWNNSRVSYYTEEGSAVGVVESLQVQLSMDSPSVVKAVAVFRLEK